MAFDPSQARVMIVGDDQSLASIVASGLKAMGVKAIATEQDGQRALYAIKAGKPKPDLVIADWDMPKLDGVGLVKALRAAGDRTRVLLVTPGSNPASVVLAKRAGVDGCLARPFSAAQLAGAVRAATGAGAAQSAA